MSYSEEEDTVLQIFYVRLLQYTTIYTLNRLSYCTCKPDFDQIQRVKHKCGHHTSTESRDQISYLDMTEHLLDMSGY